MNAAGAGDVAFDVFEWNGAAILLVDGPRPHDATSERSPGLALRLEIESVFGKRFRVDFACVTAFRASDEMRTRRPKPIVSAASEPLENGARRYVFRFENAASLLSFEAAPAIVESDPRCGCA
jgi:hypothetical protein